MTYDPAIGAAVLFGGGTVSGQLGDTWELRAGGWQNVSTGQMPFSVVYPGLVYDPVDGVVRDWGGTHLDKAAAELLIVGYDYVFDPISVSASASVAGGAAALPVQFTVDVAGGAPPLAFTWAFGDGGSSSTANASYVYYRTGTFTATVTVADAFGVNASVKLVETVTGTSVAPLTSRFTSTPSSGASPLFVAFAGIAAGGESPYLGSWTFGDGGVASGLNASHVYTSAGNWSVMFTVTDSLGGTSHSSATVHVSAGAPPGPLTIHLTANRTTGNVSLAVAFTAVASGGVAPYSFTWAFGDGATGTGSSTDHIYANAGNFTANVTLHDATGAAASATLLVHAAAPVCLCNPSPSGTTAFPSWILPVGLGVAIALAAAAALLMMRRRNRPPVSPGQEGDGAPADPEPWAEGTSDPGVADQS